MLLVEETFENNILKHQSVRTADWGDMALNCSKGSVEKRDHFVGKQKKGDKLLSVEGALSHVSFFEVIYNTIYDA